MHIRGSVAALFVIGTVAAAPSLHAQTAPARSCESLTTLNLPHASIVSAKTMAAGPMATQTIQGPVTIDVPARCEVRGVSRPSADSEIGFEVWLPSNGWNGKYQKKGNGGCAGSISRAALVDPVRRGYVAAATDDGHDATKSP